MPAYPSPAEHKLILAASELVPRTIPLQHTVVGGPGGSSGSSEATLKVTLGKHAVVAVDINL
jgi:hypothetical protein